MLRAATVTFMIGFFGLNLIETPYPLLHQSSLHRKCCCRSVTVCRCAHKHGMCPLKPQAKASFKGTNSSPVLQAAGCGFRDDHEASPTYSKDFYSETEKTHFRPPSSGSFFRIKKDHFLNIFDHRLDKPPKATLLLSI